MQLKKRKQRKVQTKKVPKKRSSRRRTHYDLIVGIDPGVATYGVALIDANNTSDVLWATGGPLTSYANNRCKQILRSSESIISVLWQGFNHLRGDQHPKNGRAKINVVDVGIEMMDLFQGAKGHASSSAGHTFQIAAVVGRLCHHFDEYFDTYPRLFLPREWKGQMSKEVTMNRVRKRIDKTSLKHMNSFKKSMTHHWDAVGIALHTAGDFH